MATACAGERVTLVQGLPDERGAEYTEEEDFTGDVDFSPVRRSSGGRWAVAKQTLLGACAACAIVGVLVSVRPTLAPRAPLRAIRPRASSSSQPAPANMNEFLGLSMIEGSSGSEETKMDLDTPSAFAPLLFCWSMICSDGYEPDLMRAQYDNNAGIFACDDHQLYSNGGVVDIQGQKTIEVKAPAAKMGDFDQQSSTNSWLNTEIFIKAWDAVMEDGSWWKADWTVKTDPDAVFFPNRLREQIEPYTRGINAQPLFVGNCDRTWRPEEKPHLAMFGSLEIFSRNAMGTYNAFKHKCVKDLPWQKWGEDLYLQSCMHYLNVQPLNKTSFLADKRCYAAPCSDPTKVAFHDFKEVEPFFDCWHESREAERALKSMSEVDPASGLFSAASPLYVKK